MRAENHKARAVFDLRIHYLDRIRDIRRYHMGRQQELRDQVVILFVLLCVSMAINFMQAFGWL